MSLDPRYIVATNLENYLVDKDTGLPLANGTVRFFQDDSRSTPKTVYQLTGSPPNYTYSALPNPMTLSAVGTTVNAGGNYTPIYYYPYATDGETVQLYYISIYSALNVLQYTLQAWPNISEASDPTEMVSTVENELSNSQFSQVLFVPSQGNTISFTTALSSVSYQIAPDWEVVISSSGAGSLTINQIALAGALNIPTNPPFAISFLPSGGTITKLLLRQTLNNNPDIWSTTTQGAGYISGIMLVNSLDGNPHTLQMQYTQSGGPSSPQVIVSGSTGVTGYQLLNNTVLLNAGTNTEDGNTGAIYIEIVLPNTGNYSVTSVQVVGLNDQSGLVEYVQDPINRQIDHLYHYYQPALNFKPIKSYLCGWDFPLNPAQALGSTVTSGIASKYTWDQTILWQSGPFGAVSRSTTGSTKGSYVINSNGGDAQFAIVQYLTLPQILDLLNNNLSSNLIVKTDNASNIKGTISLWYTSDATVPNINTSSLSLVLSVNANGKPITFNGNWSEIPRSNYGDAIFTIDYSNPNLQNFGFNGWKLDTDTIDISTVTYFAIVVGFSVLTSTKNIIIQSCSLVPGKVPTIPATQTFDEVLNDCEYYYEMSYANGTIPGAATSVGAIMTPAAGSYDGTNFDVFFNYFSIQFKQEKVTLPVYATSGFNGVTIYSYLALNGSNAIVLLAPYSTPVGQTFSSYFTLFNISKNNVAFNAVSASGVYPQHAGSTPYASTQIFHYTIDTRIGVY